jgi:PAS domain S-box-containing protein
MARDGRIGRQAWRVSDVTIDQLEALGEGLIFVFDVRRSRMRYLAAELARMLGHPMETPLDLTKLRERIHTRDWPATEAYFNNLGPLGAPEISALTLRVARPGGGWRWMEVRGRTLTIDTNGKPWTVLGVAVDITQRRTMSMALDRTARLALTAGEQERRRVVRNLHDSLAQHLVAIDLGLSRLERRLTPQSDTATVMHDIRSALSAAHREVRTYSHLLHPPNLERQGLEAALRTLLEGFARRAGLGVEIEVRGVARQIEAGVELALFRVAQEAMMNVHRHAQASHVWLRLKHTKRSIVLEIEDDGVGLAEGRDPTLPGQVGVGISGMTARLAQLGGRLELIRLPQGLALRASIPV